jgi:hypothetical protein
VRKARSLGGRRRAGEESPLFRLRQLGSVSTRATDGIADEGWLRYVLEEYGFPFTTVTNQRVRRGDLGQEFDTIIIPSQPAPLSPKATSPALTRLNTAGAWVRRQGRNRRLHRAGRHRSLCRGSRQLGGDRTWPGSHKRRGR